MKVPAGELAGVLGITEVSFIRGGESLAIVDSTLASASASVSIDNFSFTPAKTEVAVGSAVTWTNHDDIPHVVASAEKKFVSPVLDTDQQFTYTFSEPGVFTIFLSDTSAYDRQYNGAELRHHSEEYYADLHCPPRVLAPVSADGKFRRDQGKLRPNPPENEEKSRMSISSMAGMAGNAALQWLQSLTNSNNTS